MKIQSEKDPLIEVHNGTGEALMQQFKKIRADCLKMESIIGKIKTRNPTVSPTNEDIFKAATVIYNCEAAISNLYSYLRDKNLDSGPLFPFCNPLECLRSTYLWAMILASKRAKNNKAGSMGSHLSTSTNPIVLSVPHTEVNSETLDNSAVFNGESSQNESVAGPSIVTSRSRDNAGPSRPSGTKPALEPIRNFNALNKGAEGIEKLAAAAAKRSKIAEQMLEVERDRNYMTLFSMPVTDDLSRNKYLRLAQAKALREIEINTEVPASTGSCPGRVYATSSLSQDGEEHHRAAENGH